MGGGGRNIRPKTLPEVTTGKDLGKCPEIQKRRGGEIDPRVLTCTLSQYYFNLIFDGTWGKTIELNGFNIMC